MVNSFGAVQMVRRGGTEKLSLLLLVDLIVFCLFVCLLKYSRRLVLEAEIREFVAQSYRVAGGEDRDNVPLGQQMGGLSRLIKPDKHLCYMFCYHFWP